MIVLSRSSLLTLLACFAEFGPRFGLHLNLFIYFIGLAHVGIAKPSLEMVVVKPLANDCRYHEDVRQHTNRHDHKYYKAVQQLLEQKIISRGSLGH